MKNKVEEKAILVLIIYQNKLLLILRDNKTTISYPNTWAPVTGKIIKNKNILETAKHELNEELGISPENIKVLGISENGVGILLTTLTPQEFMRIRLTEGQKYKIYSFQELEKLKKENKIGGKEFNNLLEQYLEIFKNILIENQIPNEKDFKLTFWTEPTTNQATCETKEKIKIQ